MALEGTLEDFSLADIFQLIGIQRKTGILTLKRKQETVTVTFHNGMVIGADSIPKKLEDRIGKVLVKTGLITQDQLKEALEHQQKTLQKIGFILADQNYITRDQLREALQIQVAQMIYRLFRWHSGEYYFDQKARVDPDSDEHISPMSAESILMEGIQMIDEWPIIEKRIPNFNMVFRPTIGLEDLDLSDLASEDAEFESVFNKIRENAPPGSESQEKVRLSRDEAEIFLLIDGHNTVSDVIESSKLGEFHACKAMYDLLERKIIEPVTSLRPAVSPGQTAPVPMEATLEQPRTLKLTFLYPILALGLIGLLAINFKDPLKLTGFPFFSDQGDHQLRRSASFARLNQLDSALLTYFYIQKAPPEKLENMVQQNYVKDDSLLDAWSRPFTYELQGDTYTLYGYTADGQQDDGLKIRRTLELQ